MLRTSPEQRRLLENLDRHALELLQLSKFNALLQRIRPTNRFYADKLSARAQPLRSLDELREWPFTTKSELISSATDDRANNASFAPEQYVRFHRTSGTHGQPIVVLDTAADWQWWIETWQFVLDAAELCANDRVLMAFSFGPFIGFWSAHDAAVARGALVIPGGGLSSLARLDVIRTQRVNTVFCTPSYALHLAEVAAHHAIELRKLGVQRLIVAGEPGGSIPTTRDRIERVWGARVTDHAGATEVGPWGYGDPARRGLRIVESEFIAEFLSLETTLPSRDGELSELVLTTLGRAGCPVIRYRTGDLVRPRWLSDETNHFVLLDGGVLGRTDDMLIVRGVNLFPAAIEAILRGFAEVDEFRITASRQAELDVLTIEVEDRLASPARIADALQLRLGLRVDVVVVPLGSLPRFEGKGSRWIDLRKSGAEHDR